MQKKSLLQKKRPRDCLVIFLQLIIFFALFLFLSFRRNGRDGVIVVSSRFIFFFEITVGFFLFHQFPLLVFFLIEIRAPISQVEHGEHQREDNARDDVDAFRAQRVRT